MTITLRPDQQAVGSYRKGYLAVPAVPGAGKTTVLAHLAADLIASGEAAPGRVLIVTYTNSAVGNFRGRIGQYLEERGLPRSAGYEVRTIHSLAVQIVREAPEAIGWTDNFRVVDDTAVAGLATARWISRHRELFESVLRADLNNWARENALKRWEDAAKRLCRSLIQSFKSRKLLAHQAFDLTRSLPEESILRWAGDIYTEYQDELAQTGAVDFGDMMLGAYQLLSTNPDLLARLRDRWTYVFEDEAQDSYRLQEEVLRLLVGPEGNFVRVGDANQAIMGTFTSAEPDLFRRFCHQAELRPLIMAGRSSGQIIAVANELVRWTREEHPDEVCRQALEPQWIREVPEGFQPVNPRPEGYRVVLKRFDSYEDEIREVTRFAARSVERSPEGTVAILVPDHYMAGAIVEELTNTGAPVRYLGRDNPERKQTVLDLLAVLRFLAAPHQPERLVEAVHSLMHLPDKAETPFGPFLQQCRPEELFFPLDGTEPFRLLYEACPDCQSDLALADALVNLSRWLPQALIPADELVVILAGDLGLGGEELTIAHHLALRARMLLQENPAFTLTDAVQYLNGELETMGQFAGALYDRKGFQPLPGGVYVTTCHSAKGLEWDTVYVCSLTRNDFPAVVGDRFRSELYYMPEGAMNPEALALAQLADLMGEDPVHDPVTRAKWDMIGERLRLLYVAVTRAKENLFLSYHDQDRWKKRAHPTLALADLKEFIDVQRAACP